MGGPGKISRITVRDDARAFAVHVMTPTRLNAPQRSGEMREVFSAAWEQGQGRGAARSGQIRDYAFGGRPTNPLRSRAVCRRQVRLRRWVVERTFALSTRFQRLLNASERLPEVVEGRQVLSFVGL